MASFADQMAIDEYQRQREAGRAPQQQRNSQYSTTVGEVPGYVGPGGGGAMPYGGGGAHPTGEPTSGIVTNNGMGGGNIPLSRQAYEAQQSMILGSNLRTNAADHALSALNGSMGSGGATPQVSYGGGGSAEAARAAAFAKAKEIAGMNANAALKSLQDVSTRRGLGGSSVEAGAESDIIAGGRNNVANFERDQLGSDLDYINHVADTTYQGGIQQRGQNMNAKQAMLSLIGGLY